MTTPTDTTDEREISLDEYEAQAGALEDSDVLSYLPEDMVLPLPGAPDEGKRLGAISTKALAGYAEWCGKQITERKAAKKSTTNYERLLDGINRVLATREPTRGESDTPQATEPRRAEFQTPTQRIRALLTEPACADIAEDIEQQLAGGMTPHQLAQTKMMSSPRARG